MTKSVLNALPKISKKNHTNTKKRVPAAVVKAEDKKEASVAPTEVMNLGNKTAHVATPEVPTDPVKLENKTAHVATPVVPTEPVKLENKTAHVATPVVPTEPVKLENKTAQMKNNSTLSEFVESLRNCITK
jgi:hypothetical protein